MITPTNPFTFGAMIADPQRFVGRRAELDVIVARLNGVQPQGSSVVGPRRIGKSSLLHYLYRPRSGEPLQPAGNLRVFYLSAAGGDCVTPEAFRAALLRALLHEAHPDRRTKEGRQLGEYLKQLETDRTCSWEMVSSALACLPFHPVVCLDEFEALLMTAFDDRFFNALRNWANEGQLTWVSASARPLGELGQLHGRSSPFFNLLGTVRLGGLTNAEADQLLAQADSTPHPFTPAERRTARRLAGNNPYHLQIVAWQMWQTKATGHPISISDLRRFLCDQPDPPPACTRRKPSPQVWAILGLLGIIALLIAALAWQVPAFARGLLDAAGQGLNTVWVALGQVSDSLTMLILILVVLAAIIGGLRERRRLAEIARDLWEKLVRS